MKNYTQSYTRKCLYCNCTFIKKQNTSLKNWNSKSKFCSKECSDLYKIGKSTWNKGIKIDRNKYPNYGHFKKHSEAVKTIMKQALDNWKKTVGEDIVKETLRKGQRNAIKKAMENGSLKGTLGKKKELSATWLGDKATYNSKHRWIQKNWQKTGICQKCGKITQPFGKRKWGTEWHNIDNNYDREDKNSWIEVCPMCHHILNRL